MAILVAAERARRLKDDFLLRENLIFPPWQGMKPQNRQPVQKWFAAIMKMSIAEAPGNLCWIGG